MPAQSIHVKRRHAAGGRRFNEDSIVAAQRRRFVVELRSRRASFTEIAKAVAAKPELMPRPRSGRAPSYTRMQAEQDLVRAFKELNEPAADLRAMEAHKLNELEREAMRRFVREGDTPAGNLVLRCMERRARLFGLDAPVRSQIELRAHFDQLGQLSVEAIMAGLGAAIGLSEEQRSAVLDGAQQHLLAIEASLDESRIIDAEPA